MKFKSPPIHRTPLYRATFAYRNMECRCENKDGKSPTYTNVKLKMTLEEFLSWSIPKYEQFIKDNPSLSPCIARNGDKGDYELGNIELISTSENSKRQQHLSPAKETHGTLSSGRYCKCQLCKEAWRKYMKEYSKKKMGGSSK